MTTKRDLSDIRDTSNIGAELIQCLLTEIKQLPKPWPALSEAEQLTVLERLAAHVGTAVDSAVELIAGDEHPTMVCTVNQVVFKDGVKVVVKTALRPGAAHDLADSEGERVVLVACNPDEYKQGMLLAVKPDKDQGALDV